MTEKMKIQDGGRRYRRTAREFITVCKSTLGIFLQEKINFF